MVQATPEAFETAKTAYTLHGWLLQEIAEESGWEKATEMHTGLGDRWAGIVGDPNPRFASRSRSWRLWRA